MDKIKEEKTSNKSKPLVLAFTAATESPTQQKNNRLPNVISITGDSKSKPTPIDTSTPTAGKRPHSVGAKKTSHTPEKSTPTASGSGAAKKKSTPKSSGSGAAKKTSTPKRSGSGAAKKKSTPTASGSDAAKKKSTPKPSGGGAGKKKHTGGKKKH
jgi:hypothetical protein